MTLERNICASIDRLLNKYPHLWYMKIHGSPMQRAGVPDYLVLYRGRAFFLEVKNEKGKMTKLQKYVAEKIQATNSADFYLVRSAGAVKEILENYEAFGKEAFG